MSRIVLADIPAEESTKPHDIVTLQKADRMFEELYDNQAELVFENVLLNGSGEGVLSGTWGYNNGDVIVCTPYVYDVEPVPTGRLHVVYSDPDAGTATVVSSAGAADAGVHVQCFGRRRTVQP
jgi:hypothetical protein